MALLRDVLARFAVYVDDKPLTKLDKRIEKVKQNLKAFGTYAAVGFGVAAVAAYKFIDAASSANETLNVLENTFFKNTDAVLQWSKDQAKILGRSEYTLQDYASKFGAFLEPQFRGTDKDITAMSERLAGLAVDLASFYNTSDEEAQMRLFSGLSGETEAVRRLGVDISDTSLSNFNHERGDQRNLAQLTLQEKTLLRYEKILRDTEKKQGDAARTSAQWANSLKRVREQIKDITIRIGKMIIGPATKLLHWGEAFVKVMETLTFKTSAWQAAFATASVVGLAYAAKWALQFKDLLKWSDLLNKQFWMMNLRILGVVGAFVLLEDLFTLMRGGKSVFGDFITILTGIQRPVDLINRSIEKMAMHFHNMGVYIREIGRNGKLFAAVARGDFYGAYKASKEVGWDTSDLINKTKSEADDETRPKRVDDAVVAGDKEAYIAAHEGSGRSNTEIDQMWLRDRRTALRLKRAQANDMDLGSGLVSVPKFATVSNEARASRTEWSGGTVGKGGGDRQVIVNINGGDTAEVKRVVKEALDEDKRETAAAVAEFADPEEGDN